MKDKEYSMKLIDKYLQTEESQSCAHCHKVNPEKGKTVCGKCSKELSSFRNKTSKDADKDGGQKG